MRKFTTYFLTLLLVVTGMLHGYAQVTTSSMTGVVKGANGEPLVGATVVLQHESTGSRFVTVTRTRGVFDVPNIPPGGPYTITISYVGLTTYTKNNINIPLGEKFDLQAELTGSDKELQSVVVTAGRRGTTEKTGASTNISNRLVQNLPNVSRSLTNLTRLTPQSNGNSFAGMNTRYNNLMIDGSLFNNNFGRGGDGMIPGGATSAISVDAIDQVQVNIAPYDVRQAGFIGGGINAVTRRGTNNWYGTVYGFYRNENFTGKKVKGLEVPNAKRSNKTYGASIGGPIIKDKLFFFLNYESEKRTQPGQTSVAKRSATDDNPNATSVLASDLDNLRQYLINNYQYDPGRYEGYDFETDNKKFLGRLDWNINPRHRLTFRYTTSETNDDDMINSTSVTGIGGISGLNNSRRGGSKNGGMSYESSNFRNNVKVWSGVLEVNSTFTSKLSNQFIASYTKNELIRIPNSNIPFVDILNGTNTVYISFGTDLFSYKNEIHDRAWNFADNLTYTSGKHTITGGASFDYMMFANSFTSAGGPAYYRYNSLADFMSGNVPPTIFAVAYDPTNKLGIKVPEAKFGQLGIYAQDLYTITKKLKLTYGLRVDFPMYPYKPPRNPALESLVFRDENGNPEQFDVSKWPKKKPLYSPRLGFTYDAFADKSLIVRGGTGIFTGRIPFIWLVNQVGDNGVIRAIYQPGGDTLKAIRYSTDRTTYLKDFNPPAVGASIPPNSSFSAAAHDFKMPQVWRSNLAVDKRFLSDYVATFEAIYTRMINNVYFRNANLGPEIGTINGVADKRPYFNNSARPNNSVSQMIVMDNTSKGYSLSLTAQIQKTFSNNWEAGLAYTYTLAKEVAIGSSDQSGSGFNTNNITFNPNKPDIGFSNYSIPHRIVANLSYRFEYLNKQMATTVGLFYSAQPQERYTFRYGSDLNGDGQRNDVIYIPKDPSEIQFAPTYKVDGVTYTAQQQSDAFFAFIENDKYLRSHKGEYLEKYGPTLPWVHTLDMRILQDFSLKTGEKKHTLQLSLDILNLLNLLNNNWGYRYQYRYGTFQDAGIVNVASTGSGVNPVFQFNPAGANKAYQPGYTTTSTWGMQLGLRYIFN